MGVLKDIDLRLKQIDEPLQTHLRQEFARRVAQTDAAKAPPYRRRPTALCVRSKFEQRVRSPEPNNILLTRPDCRPRIAKRESDEPSETIARFLISKATISANPRGAPADSTT